MLIGTDGIPAGPAESDTERLPALWGQSRACSGLVAAALRGLGNAGATSPAYDS